MQVGIDRILQDTEERLFGPDTGKKDERSFKVARHRFDAVLSLSEAILDPLLHGSNLYDVIDYAHALEVAYQWFCHESSHIPITDPRIKKVKEAYARKKDNIMENWTRALRNYEEDRRKEAKERILYMDWKDMPLTEQEQLLLDKYHEESRRERKRKDREKYEELVHKYGKDVIGQVMNVDVIAQIVRSEMPLSKAQTLRWEEHLNQW